MQLWKLQDPTHVPIWSKILEMCIYVSEEHTLEVKWTLPETELKHVMSKFSTRTFNMIPKLSNNTKSQNFAFIAVAQCIIQYSI